VRQNRAKFVVDRSGGSVGPEVRAGRVPVVGGTAWSATRTRVMTDRLDITSLLADLTLAEKASLLSGRTFWHTKGVDRLAIPAIMVADGPHGLRKQDPDNADHVGLQGSVPATCFPTAAGLASSWDAALVRRVGEAIATEARAQELAVVLGPGINIKRSPLCGRNFEYLSEDPVLTAILGTAMVEGIQSKGVGTSLKHFALNNQETDRFRASSDVDERTMREIYLAGFERVVRNARPWTVMCSYNRINGEWASQDRWLLTDVLRGEWGFDGLVVSDWGAVVHPPASVAAGLDLEMPTTGAVSARMIVAAVESGELDVADVDRSVERVLTLIDRALPGLAAEGDTVDADAHHDLARAAARQAAVLLTNDGTLPLRLDAGARLAVVGEFARTPRFQGAGSSKVNPTRLTTALDALRELVPGGVTIDFAPGFGVDDPDADDAALADEAVALAADAQVVVAFLGLPPSYESEGYDRTDMDLPAEQLALLARLAEGPAKVVVVLSHGSVVTVAPWLDQADAILDAWLGGQASGGAVADLLLGVANPSGKLAETIPLRIEDNPSYLSFGSRDGHVRYGEGRFVGYRHYDALHRDVAFPFGFGLSYTDFTIDGVTVTATDGDERTDEAWRGPVRATVTATVTNTGSRAGAEVVQVYVGRPDLDGARPVRELAAFARVELEPGASEKITLHLTERDASVWSEREGAWRYEPGPATVWVGTSSRDLPVAAEITFPGTVTVAPLDAGSTVGEWWEHPAGHEVFLDALRNSAVGDFSGLISDPEGFQMLRSIPLARLNRMTGGIVPPVEEVLAKLPAEARA